jgi:RNA-binding protein
MRLTDEQIDFLRVLGHQLRPAVDIGAGGLTTFVVKQIEQALATHELVKVRVPFGDRRRRSDVIDELAPKTEAQLIQRAHNAAVLYRPAEVPVIALPVDSQAS